MTSKLSRPLVIASSMAVLLALGACGERNDGTTVGQKVDAGIASTAEAGREVKADVKDAAANASVATQEATADAKTAVMGAAAETKEATANLGATIDDAGITAKVKTGLAADKDLAAIKIDVDTKGGVVTLTGPAPTAAAKERAGDIAKNVKDVKSVNNNLTAG